MNDLSKKEIERLRQKLKLSIKNLKFHELANFHGAPLDICEPYNKPCCSHGDPTFLPWHRLYLVNMEEMLDEALPYWDWTEDTQIPQLWENIRVPFKKEVNSTLPAEGEKSRVPGFGDCPPGQSCGNIKMVQVPMSLIGEKGKGREVWRLTQVIKHFLQFYLKVYPIWPLKFPSL